MAQGRRAVNYAVVDRGLSGEDLRALDRRVLAHLAPRAVTIETDLPEHGPGAWPPDVEAAAQLLRRHSHPGADPDRYCIAGGDVGDHPDLWDAFVLVAPYAYDAEVRDADGTEVASLSDEGSLVVTLDAEQHEHLATLVGAHRLKLLEAPRRCRWAPWRHDHR